MTVVAIDFGTSNTVVCVQDPVSQMPHTLTFERISRQFDTAFGSVSVVPTLLFVQSPDQIRLGEEVRSQRLGFVAPDRLFQAFKRDLVAEYVPPARQLDGQTYTAARIAQIFLSQVFQRLQQAQVDPTQVILTVPVGSFEPYLNWIREVAANLGWLNVQIVDESTAAALGYAVAHPGSVVLVLDFGGGTLDLSLVKTTDPKPGQTVLRADVIAKSDAYVGGIDIDSWIAEYFLSQIGSTRAAMGNLGWQNLVEISERVKIQLSSQDQVTESWFDDESLMAYELKICRNQLEEILETQQLLEQIRQALDELLLMAQTKGIPKSAIQQVLLVGGSCQIPAIQNLVISYFGRQRVRLDKPFEAVAHGALALAQQIQIEDYLRHTYAIRLWDPTIHQYTYFPLFEKGTTYPCQRPDPLVLQVASDGQQEIRLEIGEVAEVAQSEVIYDAQGRMSSRSLTRQADFRSLSGSTDPVCLARLQPAGKVGIDRIRVQFAVNAQRVLVATIEDLLTQQVLVKEQAVASL